MKKEKKCPKCNSRNIVPITYGYPSSKGIKESEEGNIILGGCCVEDKNDYCKDCSYEW